jgi:hypothetical protein
MSKTTNLTTVSFPVAAKSDKPVKNTSHCTICAEHPALNKETINALNEDTTNLPRFDSVEALMAYLASE